MKHIFLLVVAAVLAVSCEIVDNDPDKHVNKNDSTYVGLGEVAKIFSKLSINLSHVIEVQDAVTSSSGNGYDEEYTMKQLFESPGSGVGDKVTKEGDWYVEPLRDLIEDYLYSESATKSDGLSIQDPDKFIDALTNSDVQIYWPFSEEWDGKTLPVITFDPEDGSEVNVGYSFVVGDDGFRHVEEVFVDEAMAEKVPVWVVNRNSDSGYLSLEMIRRDDPDWGEGGGNIIVRQCGISESKSTKPLKSLILKDFTMKRNYDSWFAGASEFFVKIGYLPNFTASTEAELKLYNPLVTDFMVVVKRKQVGIPQQLNVMLMSDWYEHENVDDACALMITEDDGGTKDDWTTKAKVFVAGKSYGIEISLPFNQRDDIVWRGMLTNKWLDRNTGDPWSFGDVDLTFEVREY